LYLPEQTDLRLGIRRPRGEQSPSQSPIPESRGQYQDVLLTFDVGTVQHQPDFALDHWVSN
jgi:hypothetical protein